MRLGRELHAPAVLPHTLIVKEDKWFPGLVWRDAEKSKFLAPTGIQTPDLTAFRRTLYPLCRSAPQQKIAKCK